jgi:hypothetical protein
MFEEFIGKLVEFDYKYEYETDETEHFYGQVIRVEKDTAGHEMIQIHNKWWRIKFNLPTDFGFVASLISDLKEIDPMEYELINS